MNYTVDDILKSLDSRSPRGIGVAAGYLRTVEPCLSGSGLCPTKAFDLASAFDWQKAIKDAETKLTYCDFGDSDFAIKAIGDGDGSPFILEYDAILSHKDMDRDGDILDPLGMELDAKMPLLWHHVPFQPIGRMVKVLEQNESHVKCRFGIVGTDLGHDAAILVKAGCLRKSHGFKPSVFEPVRIEKMADGKEIVRGWHIKSSKVFEGSLVSIPANAKAEVTNIVSENFALGKFHSPITKSWAKAIHDARPVIVPGYSTKGDMSVNAASDKKPCPKCKDGKLDSSGTCPTCGYVQGGDGKAASDVETKAGRVLSAANVSRLRAAVDKQRAAIAEMESLLESAGDAAMSETATQPEVTKAEQQATVEETAMNLAHKCVVCSKGNIGELTEAWRYVGDALAILKHQREQAEVDSLVIQ